MRVWLFAILMLFILMGQSLFPLLSLTLKRNECRRHFSKTKAQLRRREMKTFVFPTHSSIAWEKENEEFSWEGMLYDVISMEKTDAFLRITCVADHKEHEVVQAFFKNIEEPDHHKKAHHLKIKRRLLKYCPPTWLLLNFSFFSQARFTGHYPANCLPPFMTVDHPPPEEDCRLSFRV